MTLLPEGLRAMLFDLDDTLYDRETVFLRWADHFVRRLDLDTDEERREAVALIASFDADGYGSKQAVFIKLALLFPTLWGDRRVIAADAYEEFLAGIVLEPETDRVLRALEQAAVPWGIVTNGSARQWHKLERLNLHKRTPCVFVSSSFGRHKPEPAIFLAAAQKLGVPSSEILFVGDNPVNDIFGAHRAGMKTAWLHRDKPWPDALADLSPDYTIERLEEVIGCLMTRGSDENV